MPQNVFQQTASLSLSKTPRPASILPSPETTPWAEAFPIKASDNPGVVDLQSTPRHWGSNPRAAARGVRKCCRHVSGKGHCRSAKGTRITLLPSVRDPNGLRPARLPGVSNLACNWIGRGGTCSPTDGQSCLLRTFSLSVSRILPAALLRREIHAAQEDLEAWACQRGDVGQRFSTKPVLATKPSPA